MKKIAKRIVSILLICILSVTSVPIVTATTNSDWTLSGRCSYDSSTDVYTLLPDSTWTTGTMKYNDSISSDFSLSLDYYTGNRSGGEDSRFGGDGFAVFFYCKELKIGNYWKPTSGYSVEIDTYCDDGFEKKQIHENHVAINSATSDHLAVAPIVEAEDDDWHNLNIIVRSGICTVYIDGTERISYETPANNYDTLGIYCVTGAARNLHAVKNIEIKTGADVSGSQIPGDAVEFNGHYYKAFDISKSWTDAKAYCEDLGGHLVTITSNEEQKFIETILKNPIKNTYWIGLTTTDNKPSWLTGEKYEFSNWAEEQPDNCIAGEYYVHIYAIDHIRDEYIWQKKGQWNDVTNDLRSGEGYDQNFYNLEKSGFICEWDSKGDVSGEYYIAGKKFDKNIDYYTANCSSSVYNPELANMTAALSKAVYSADEIEKAYLSLGFDEDQFGFYDYGGEFNPYKSGHTIGFKKSEYNDDIICLVVVRGTIMNSVSDWIGNISIDTTFDGKHIGFAYPANYIYLNIEMLLEKYNYSGNIKYVITGHSRGAAVANLLAVDLMEKGVSASDIYNYNFACPDVACKSSFSVYGNIFNLCNREDPVPFVPGHLASVFTIPGTAWGKYGRTIWFTKDAEGTINPVADHDMSLYLEFFDKKLNLSEWDYSLEDLEDDVKHILIGWVAKMLCPVDVIVTDTDGNRIASVISGEVNYYDSNFGDVIILTDGDKKVIFVSGDRDFNIELIGTDDGTMTYSVEKCNLATEEISESKTFENVKLEKGKEMYSPVSNAETTEDIELFVVEDEKGEDIKTHTIGTDGSETEINHIYETEVVNPTCTEKGYTVYTCSNCSDSYKDSYVDALGHSDANYDGICDICSEDFAKGCSCNCHGNAFMQFLHKIVSFLRKLFGMTQYQYCGCGKAHW